MGLPTLVFPHWAQNHVMIMSPCFLRFREHNALVFRTHAMQACRFAQKWEHFCRLKMISPSLLLLHHRVMSVCEALVVFSFAFRHVIFVCHFIRAFSLAVPVLTLPFLGPWTVEKCWQNTFAFVKGKAPRVNRLIWRQACIFSKQTDNLTRLSFSIVKSFVCIPWFMLQGSKTQ